MDHLAVQVLHVQVIADRQVVQTHPDLAIAAVLLAVAIQEEAHIVQEVLLVVADHPIAVVVAAVAVAAAVAAVEEVVDLVVDK